MDMPGMKMGGMSGMDHGSMSGMDHSGMAMEPKMNMDHGGRMMGGGVVHNSRSWYDFLLREDAAQYPHLAKDSMMSKARPFPPYEQLRAVRKTAFKKGQPQREVRLTLDGDMGRYVWMFNNQPLKPENDIKINKGEVVKFIFINRTMMHHPLHLHGHFFRVLNRYDENSPLKHTVNVAPMTTTIIEFDANEVGDWFFHCHLLYHMKGGMARVVRYNEFTNNPETEAVSDKRYDQHWYLFARMDALSNMNQGTLMYENLRNTFSLSWEAGWDGVTDTIWEGEFAYDRYINRFTSVFAGVYAEGVDFNSDTERLIAGVRYTLPQNFATSTWIDSDGEARFSIGRELMLTPRLGIFGDAEYDTREKWSGQAGMSYMINENISATGLWDSDYGIGGGFTIKF